MATAAFPPGERPADYYAEREEMLSPARGDNNSKNSSPRAAARPESGAGAAAAGGAPAGVNQSKAPSNFMERVQARVRSDAPTADYREDIVRSIFGDVGTPVEGETLMLI